MCWRAGAVAPRLGVNSKNGKARIGLWHTAGPPRWWLWMRIRRSVPPCAREPGFKRSGCAWGGAVRAWAWRAAHGVGWMARARAGCRRVMKRGPVSPAVKLGRAGFCAST
eukprot:scaffold8015_cov149-Isochrysis_galbana.AAC.4